MNGDSDAIVVECGAGHDYLQPNPAKTALANTLDNKDNTSLF